MNDPGPTHRHRTAAESFGADATRYDRSRPRYPQALVHRIAVAAPGADVLDVGCGTGIVARQFAAEGCRVRGVDVDERMAEAARERGVDAAVAPFETWDAAGARFDALVSGQTWHWIDPAAGAARAAELLRPDGLLAVFWNAGQVPAALARRFADVYRSVAPDSPLARGFDGSAADGYALLGDKAADGIRATGAFGEPERSRDTWQRTYAKEEWLDQVPTSGAHALLTATQQAEIVKGVGTALDAAGGAFTMQYTTVAVVARRTS